MRFSTSELGKQFREGATKGRSSNTQIVDGRRKTYLVDYGWAILAERDKVSGKITYYSGWRGYSTSTSKHIGQLGLYNADRVMKSRKRLEDVL